MAEIPRYSEPLWVEPEFLTRFQGFQNLMRFRIRDVLLVSSLYDLYLFEEDGRLYELLRDQYQGLNLSHSPELTRVSSGKAAIELAKEEKRFDLILTTLHIEDMTALQLAQLVRESKLNVPIILLGYDDSELGELLTHQNVSVFDNVFIWHGDFRLLIGIIKHLEDKMNVDHDTRLVGVQSILVIEDNVRYYSSFLPLIYSELFKQSQRLISEGINLSHRYLRMRARPKILLCRTYEEAWNYFKRYKECILGVISDMDFPRKGKEDPQAGLRFAEAVRESLSDVPILIQTTSSTYEKEIRSLTASLLPKNSPTLLNDLSHFMYEHFSFGDFIFRTPDGREVGRARDLKSLEESLCCVPEESLRFHGERNHFSNWLKARTEFGLAHQLKPRKVSDYPSVSKLREHLITTLREYRTMRQRGLTSDFKKESFDPQNSFARIGGGSLGGKARGLGFVNLLINNFGFRDRFKGVNIHVPAAAVIGTDVFDQFLDENNLREFALKSQDDQEIARRFLSAERFPEEILADLSEFLDRVLEPLAVRSSSLLEDSQYHPFAGLYETHMIPNNHPNPATRLRALVDSIKRVYASTFYQGAKNYIKVTSYRLEEEKMAVIVQRMVGASHGDRFYPDFSGVAKSHNFYPVAPQKSQDGIVSVALGLGKMVIDGGMTIRFSPKYPSHVLQLFSPDEALKNTQNEFFSLYLQKDPLRCDPMEDLALRTDPLDVAEKDGTLHYVGSTYSPENDGLYDGLSRSGVRVVTFAPILKNKLFPLSQIIDLLLEKGVWGMGTPVEIEFAVKMSVEPGRPKEFGILQMRPMVLNREMEELDIGEIDPGRLICSSSQVLGHGIRKDLYDIVVVDIKRYDRSKSSEVVLELAEINQELVTADRPYLLVGVGRWGSLDSYLGIPVKWDQISGARAIVESSFRDLVVLPSQGTHFFQNITSFLVGYFSVIDETDREFIDWEWLTTQPACKEMRYTRHLRFSDPVITKIDGHQNRGIILKPRTPPLIIP